MSEDTPDIQSILNITPEIKTILNDEKLNLHHCHNIISSSEEIQAHSLQYFSAPQVANIYNFPSGVTGKNQVVAIIELGGGYNMSDINYYFKNLGYTQTPNIVSVSVDGAVNNPADTSGANYEVLLDIEIVIGIAPDVKVVVYFAPNSSQGFYNAIYTAINDSINTPSIISISWGSAEINWSKSTMLTYDSLFATAVSKGINIFASSGDYGSSDGKPGLNVIFPASSPNVISCGGTTLTLNGSTKIETAWLSGGGGFSTTFAVPNYQQKFSNIKIGRGIPDICANANPSTGYKIFIDNSYSIIGGTSAVSPLWSSLIALIQEKISKNIGSLIPILYNNPKSCSDVVSGSNGAYSSITGWDPCTGLGSPIGTSLLAVVYGPPTPVPSPTGFMYTGILYAPGTYILEPKQRYYYSYNSGFHTGYLVAPINSEFYLYLYKWSGGNWAIVSKSTVSSNIQTVSYTGTLGYYIFLVYDHVGSGNYTLYIDRPT